MGLRLPTLSQDSHQGVSHNTIGVIQVPARQMDLRGKTDIVLLGHLPIVADHSVYGIVAAVCFGRKGRKLLTVFGNIIL